MKETRHVQVRFRDARAQRVIGFLAAKKLLITDQFKLWPNTKLRLDDVLWVGKNVEPRVLEVLPAALIHFPKTFIGKNDMPAQLENVIDAIRNNRPEGPDFEGMRYRNMKRWVNRTLPDKRTKPLKEQKRNKTFRLVPEAIEKLKRMAKMHNTNETQVLEKLILEK